MKKLNIIFQPLALQLNSPFAKAEASCTHISYVNALHCAWAYNIMMTRNIMQRCSNHVVWQNTVRCITSSAAKSINTTQKRFCNAAKSINTTQKRLCNAAKSINTTQKRFCSATKSINTTQKRFCSATVMQNTIFNHTNNNIVWQNTVTNHTNNKIVWKNIRIRHTKQLVRCRNDTTAACCTIVHLKRCMPTAWIDASAI